MAKESSFPNGLPSDNIAVSLKSLFELAKQHANNLIWGVCKQESIFVVVTIIFTMPFENTFNMAALIFLIYLGCLI